MPNIHQQLNDAAKNYVTSNNIVQKFAEAGIQVGRHRATGLILDEVKKSIVSSVDIKNTGKLNTLFDNAVKSIIDRMGTRQPGLMSQVTDIATRYGTLARDTASTGMDVFSQGMSTAGLVGTGINFFNDVGATRSSLGLAGASALGRAESFSSAISNINTTVNKFDFVTRSQNFLFSKAGQTVQKFSPLSASILGTTNNFLNPITSGIFNISSAFVRSAGNIGATVAASIGLPPLVGQLAVGALALSGADVVRGAVYGGLGGVKDTAADLAFGVAGSRAGGILGGAIGGPVGALAGSAIGGMLGVATNQFFDIF